VVEAPPALPPGPPAWREPLLHVGRYGRSYIDWRAILIERHDDFTGEQLQTGAAGTRRRAVDRIAEDRPAHFGAMYPQLMCAAGERLQCQPAQFCVGGSSQHSPSRYRRLAVGIMLHPPAACIIEATECQLDCAFIRLRAAFDDSPI